MMGRAITYDLATYSQFTRIILADKDPHTLTQAKKLLKGTTVDYTTLNATNSIQVTSAFKDVDIAVSAVPYYHNAALAKAAIATATHFIDLGGNNDIVAAERAMHTDAINHKVTVIPDSGLAPGLVSIITRDIADTLDTVTSVKLRVGGLPVHPRPPLNYQLVFSPDGLINEYVEDALVLDHGRILTKPSMTELEPIRFPPPFGHMEAFLTSGGCSTLPTTYKTRIQHLDYKTIRYPGHCDRIKTLLDLGLADIKPLVIGHTTITPRAILTTLLRQHLPTEGDDVVLLKVLGEGTKHGRPTRLDYTLIDYCDTHHGISAMMRTTGYPVSITAQLLHHGTIHTPGVFCPEEIVPFSPMQTELRKRGVNLRRTLRQRR